jgi:hypothetical protein
MPHPDPVMAASMRRLCIVCVCLVACTAAPSSVDPLANVRARVWAVPSDVASDAERFEDMRRHVPPQLDREGFVELFVRHRDGWIYGASASGTCGVVSYLDADLVVRDVETFMGYGSLRFVTADEPNDPIEVIEHWHAGTGLDAVTRYAVTVVDGRIERVEAP